MGFFGKIKEFFAKFFKKAKEIFIEFVKEAFGLASQIAIAEIKDFAIEVVAKLAETDLKNIEKRQKAFRQIKDEAVKRGYKLKDSLVYTIIELALQYVKKNIEKADGFTG